MAEDPYAPPKSAVADPGGERQGSFLKAILLGSVTDIGGTYARDFVLPILLGIVAISIGGSADADMPTTESITLRVFLFITGAGLSVLGGYVAARIANRAELKVSLLNGVSVFVIGGLLTVWEGGGFDFLPEQFFLMFAVVLLSLLGGWLHQNRKRRAPTLVTPSAHP
jgi:hypothetical protein